jgi:flagellar export protein FliJ
MNATRVASILRVRRLQERQARGHLAAGHHVHTAATRAEQDTRDHVRACADRRSTELTLVSKLLTERAVIVSGLLAASSRRADTEHAAADVATLTDAWSVTARRVDALERMDERIRENDRIELDRVERAEVDDLVSARHPKEVA